MDTTTLEYIIAIADEQSITKAADKFFLSQPALSQQLKKIETEIGAPLFIRSKNNWQLTDVGKVYINGARSILHIQNTGFAKLEELRILHEDKINLIVATGLHNFVNKRIVPVFKEMYPNIELNFQVGDNLQIQDYMSNGLPYLAVLFVDDNPQVPFESNVVFKDEYYLCINKKNPLNKDFADKFDISKLKDELFILSRAGTTHRAIQEKFFKDNDIHPTVLNESASFSGAIHMLKNGYGCTFLPKSLCQTKSIIFDFYETDPKINYNVSCGYPKGHHLSNPYFNLIEILEKKFKTEFKEYSFDWITDVELNMQ